MKTQELSLEQIADKLALNRMGRSVGLINGCFDVCHSGHLEFINQARKSCDILVIAVNSDKSVSELKGPLRPINGLVERIDFLLGLEKADFILAFDEPYLSRVIDSIKPDFYLKPETDIVEAEVERILGYGGAIIKTKKKPNRSTTKLVAKILDNYNQSASIDFLQKYYETNQGTMKELIRVEYQFLYLYVTLVAASLTFFSAFWGKVANFKNDVGLIASGSTILIIFFLALSTLLKDKIKENNKKYNALAKASVNIWEVFGLFAWGKFTPDKSLLDENARRFGSGPGYKNTILIMNTLMIILAFAYLAVLFVCLKR
jgi:rfaE bifunctional protein nucleotidyltransferase chain/domain